jgi:hypothetical protein
MIENWKEKEVDEFGNTHYISEDERWDIVKLHPYRDIFRVYDLHDPVFNTSLIGGYYIDQRKEQKSKVCNKELKTLVKAKEWASLQVELEDSGLD